MWHARELQLHDKCCWTHDNVRQLHVIFYRIVHMSTEKSTVRLLSLPSSQTEQQPPTRGTSRGCRHHERWNTPTTRFTVQQQSHNLVKPRSHTDSTKCRLPRINANKFSTADQLSYGHLTVPNWVIKQGKVKCCTLNEHGWVFIYLFWHWSHRWVYHRVYNCQHDDLLVYSVHSTVAVTTQISTKRQKMMS